MSPRSLAIVLSLLGTQWLAPASRAWADPEGDRILSAMDRKLTSAHDQFFEYEMITRVPGHPPRASIFQVTIKGSQWRRIDFLSPGDIKDMRVLILALDKMYVYLPAYRKVRRVASHVRDQGFMGSAFSHDDMSVVTYADKLSAHLVDQDELSWTLEAIRRTDSDYRYSKLRMRISKQLYHPLAIEYFNDQGVLTKSEIRQDYECHGAHCNPKRIALTDHTRSEVTSVLQRRVWKVDTGVPDSFFTVRALQRRR